MQWFLGWVHAIIGLPIFLFWTAMAGVGIAISTLFAPFDHGRRLSSWWLSMTWGGMLWWTQPCWHRAIVGLENLGEGPYVVVANHRSTVDILALFGLPLPLRMVAKRSAFTAPLAGRFFQLSGQVSPANFMQDARRALDAGVSVVVFAEGGRTNAATMRRFKRGAFQLAVETGHPIVPIAIEGSYFITAKGRFIPTQFGVPVVVAVGKPINGDQVEPLRTAVRSEVGRLLAEVRSHVQFEPEGSHA